MSEPFFVCYEMSNGDGEKNLGGFVGGNVGIVVGTADMNGDAVSLRPDDGE